MSPVSAPSGGDSADYRDTLFAAQERWDLIKQVCKQKSRSVAALLHSARPVLVEPGEVPMLVLQADHRFHLDKLRAPASREAVEWALEQVLEARVRIRVVPNRGDDASGQGGAGDSRSPDGSGKSGGSSSGSGIRPPSSSHRTGGAASPNGTHPAPPDTANNGPAAHNGTNGTNGARDALRDAGEAYTPANITPIRAAASRATAIAANGHATAARALDDEARADAVIQAAMHTYGAELADVRPLNDEDGGE